MYFSVKKPLKILNKQYIPCICYECGRDLESTINDLVAKGIAKVHIRKVHFCNGVELPDPRKPRTTKSKKEVKGF